jgi:hypothetical protein
MRYALKWFLLKYNNEKTRPNTRPLIYLLECGKEAALATAQWTAEKREKKLCGLPQADGDWYAVRRKGIQKLLHGPQRSARHSMSNSSNKRGDCRGFAPKFYKYNVVSTIFNDDIYGIEIIYLQERLHVLVNILAMGSLVWWCCLQLTIIIKVVGLLSRQKASSFGCLLLYTVRSLYKILAL